LSVAIMGESHAVGTGAAGFGGAAAGLVVAGAAGAAGFGDVATGAAGWSEAGFVSDCTEPEGVAFTPPGVAG